MRRGPDHREDTRRWPALAPALDRAIQDPDWTLDFVEEVQDESEPALAEARHFSTYKVWDLLRFLLARTEFPVNVTHGEEPFAEEQDWEYGPSRYLRPERVRLAAEALRATSYVQLVRDVDHAELTSAEVYPLGWREPSTLEWGRPWCDDLKQFIEAAARSNDAMFVWLD